MSYYNASGDGMGNYPIPGNCQKSSWYCKLIKPLFSFIVSVTLALSMSHLCEKYSNINSFETIKGDLNILRNHMSLLSNEVRLLVDSREDFNNKLKEITSIISQLKNQGEGTNDRSSDGIAELVKRELQYLGSDKTGKPDYALEVSGGMVLSTRDTITYDAGEPVAKLFGLIPICKRENTPRAIIQTGTLPGECWAFKGSEGSVVIQLLGEVHISEFSIEHIPLSISPPGHTDTAPKDFSVLGLDSVEDKKGFLFGTYTYNNSGSPIQFFKAKDDPSRSFEIVELKIHSNNGNKDYTCIYRFRVHGTPGRILQSKIN